MEEMRYPIGRFQSGENISPDDIAGWIRDIEQLPADLEKEVRPLTDAQLDTPYREQGWSVRTLIHHVADSHANAYIRFKLALTEDCPTIKPYQQERWSDLDDSSLPPEPSLKMIEGIHRRWTHLLNAMEPEDFERELIHPESGKVVLNHMTGTYAWHGNHHLAHITSLKKRNNWS